MTDGEEQERRAVDFFDSVGRAVVLWAEVELEVFALLKAATGLPDAQAAIIYDRAGTIAPRIRMVAELLAAAEGLPQSAVEHAVAALADLKSIIFVRNLIVHHPAHWTGSRIMVRLLDEDDPHVAVVDSDPGRLSTVRNSIDQLTGKRAGSTQRIDADGIRKHHDQVHEIRGRLIAALADISQRP